MRQNLTSKLLLTLSLLFFIGCGGGGGGSGTPPGNGGGNIDNVVVDPQAYYIDAVNGNDTNDGKTPQTAWKSLAKLNSIKINAGNKLLFRTGQTWQGQLEIKDSGTLENPIEIGSYGEGAKPVLTAVGIVQIRENNNNNDVEDGEWIPYNASGGNGLGIQFKEPVPDPANTWLAVILDSHPGRVKVNGQELVGAFDSSELGNTFKWSYNRDKGGTVFYWYGNDKPSQIETNLYTAPLYIYNSAYVKVDDIELKGGYVSGLFIEKASHIYVQNVTTGDMSQQGIYVKAESSNAKDIRITNCTIDSRYALDYSMATPNMEKHGRTTTTRGATEGIMFWGGVQDSVISGNFIKNWTHASINFSADHDEELAGNSVANNELLAPDIAYGGRLALDGKNNHNNSITGNTIHDIRSPIQFNGHDNLFENNNVYNVFQSVLKPEETGFAVLVQGYSSPVYNNKIINNTFKNIAKTPVIKIIDNSPYPVTNITTTPNTYE